MTYNMKMIEKHMPIYLKTFKTKFKRAPQSWWNFTTWLCTQTYAQSYTPEEVNRVKELMGL